MRPGKAYIASFSTTGLLIALALLLLVVVGALMAFRERADADRTPGASDVVVEAEPVRVGTLSERAAAREAAVAADLSTTGVVLTPAAPAPEVLDATGTPMEVPGGAPGTDGPAVTGPTASPPPEPAGEDETPGGGIELDGGVDGLVSPETGDALAQLVEQFGGTFQGEEPDAVTGSDSPPAR